MSSERSFQDEFNVSNEFIDGRYKVILPFKPNCNQLEDTYGVSYQRLKSLWKIFHKNPKLLSQYNDIILDQKEQHIIEEANHTATNATQYLPRRSVIRSEKVTTPMRMVFNASS